MTVAFKKKQPVVVPEAALRRAGFKRGQGLKSRASGGVITILPKLPTADDEYTPQQRRTIDAQLARGLADIKAGRTRGPFNSAAEMIADMKAQIKRRVSVKPSKRVR